MALDAQRNWTVSMAESLEQVLRSNMDNEVSNPVDTLKGNKIYKPMPATKDIHLPDELLLLIVEHIASTPPSQAALATCCLLSRQWYAVAVPLLYARPWLYGGNFAPFARTLCPSINLAVRHTPLAALLRRLDLSRLVHQGSKSLTARLLGRTKAGLEEFVAPQASFAVNCLPALAKCSRLRVVDLSLISECPPLPDLFKALARLDSLRVLRLPRSSGFGGGGRRVASPISWPPNLYNLTLSGGIDAYFPNLSLPPTIRALNIEHCPQTTASTLRNLLIFAARSLPDLASLTIRHMPRLGSRALDDLLIILPQILRLSVSVDYISPAFFAFTHISPSYSPLPSSSDAAEQLQEVRRCHINLRVLELTNSGEPGLEEDEITPSNLVISIANERTLPSLRQVCVASSLRWDSPPKDKSLEVLADTLEEAASGDVQGREEAGVYVIKG